MPHSVFLPQAPQVNEKMVIGQAEWVGEPRATVILTESRRFASCVPKTQPSADGLCETIRPGTPERMSLRLASTYHGLPSEIWDHVLECLPPAHRQQTALALSRALPASGASQCHLFAYLTITSDDKPILLYHRFGRRYADAQEVAQAVKTCRLECWRPDPDLIVNLIRMMPSLCVLHLRVGPLWSPEPIEDLFSKPLTSIRMIDLRFNPYVRKKTYYTFLKGAYYDCALECMAKWPAMANFSTLAFVQDVTPDLPGEGSDQGNSENLVPSSFAQPLVLFKTFCISSFASSNAALHIKYLRLRIPHRSILSALSSNSTSTTVQPSDDFCRPLPSLELLDISTSFVPLGPGLKALLLRHTALQHLIMDHTGWSQPDAFHALGTMASSIGVQRARDAHRAWRTLLMKKRDTEATTLVQSSSAAQPVSRGRRAGRNAFSEATPAQRRRDAAVADSMRFSATSSARYATLPLACYILPSYSHLRSICCGSGSPRRDHNPANAEAFREGWTEGSELVGEVYHDQLKAWRRPFTQGSLNGRKVLCRFAEAGESLPLAGETLDAQLDVWEQLKRNHRLIECADDATLTLRALDSGTTCILCTEPDCSGSGSVAWSDGVSLPLGDDWRPASEETHALGCGHLLARKIFQDDL